MNAERSGDKYPLTVSHQLQVPTVLSPKKGAWCPLNRRLSVCDGAGIDAAKSKGKRKGEVHPRTGHEGPQGV